MQCMLHSSLGASISSPVGIVPVQLIQSIPYILTVVLLAGFVGKAVAPKAIGEPFIKEHK